MVFSSAIFLFVFLPLTFLIYRAAPGIKIKNLILTIASLIFYSFGQPIYIILLLISVTCNYIAGAVLSEAEKHRKLVIGAAVAANVLLLGVFKYADFAINNVNGIFGTGITPTGITLPIGISFYTFQGMSYIIDVYRDKTMGTKNYLKLLLYISLFPQLIAGPIVKYHDVASQIDNRKCTMQMTAEGIRRFIIGLSKKLLLSNTMGEIADTVYALDGSQLDIRIAWIGAICYTLQIYFDFSGYSDMAIGLGRMFGFRFLENFNYPYKSTTIKEFWRRWHISLSSWFRDYLYIPLGGSYCSKAKTMRNKLIVFFTTGLWHGANWTFILWGMWHGLFSVAEESRHFPVKKLENRFAGHVYTMLVVILGFVLFRAATLSQAGGMFVQMFAGFNFTPEKDLILSGILTKTNIAVFIFAVVLSVDLLPRIKRRIGYADTEEQETDLDSRSALQEMQAAGEPGAHGRRITAFEYVSYAAALLLLIIDIMNLTSTTFNPFIYFQF
ncbi:MAG: MBOAT family protein [Firmicutes bacterium]|nr:MBOAT family protein [Bacillota bacterium]